MNRRTIAGILGLCIFLLGALAVYAARLIMSPERADNAVQAFAPPAQGYPPPGDLPLAGWSVCLVGDMEQIPGDGVRQVFNLCHADGFRIKTYCLDPEKPVPALGTLCSQVVGGGYWCGDAVQQLGFLELLQGAEDTSTPTVTFTATFTSTVPASTATFTSTVTATPGATLTPGLATLQFTMTPTLRSTPYERPPAGGMGNLTPLLGGLGTLGALAAGRAAWTLRKRKPGRRG